MVGAARDANQVSGLDLYREDRAVGRVNVEETTAFHDKANLVFVVPMLAAELRQHHVEIRRRRRHVDHVRGGVTAARLQFLNLVAVRVEHCFGIRIRGNDPRGLPSLVRDAVRREEARDSIVTVDCLLAFRNFYQGHGRLPQASPSVR